MSEQDWCNKVVLPGLRKHGTVSKNENAAATGSPDYEYVINGTSGWFEAKVVHGSFVLFEKFQLPWMRKRVRETGVRNIWVLVSDATSVYLFESETLVRAPREPYRKWVRVNIRELSPRLSLLTKPYDWALVARVLSEVPKFTAPQNSV